MQLTKKQQIIADSIESSTDNFAILGKPGVGKSVLINWLVENGQKNYTIAAPTGLAAINVGGKTLHSLFKIPIFENGIIPADMSPPDRKSLMHLSKVTTLVIDEVSMVRADILDYVDRVLQHFRQSEKAFGGIQVILVGDFCQLPPVVKPLDKLELRTAKYRSEFAFDAHVFKKANFELLQLTEVLRQKGDLYFMEILNAARFGTVDKEMIKTLNTHVGKSIPQSITLTGTNNQADMINSERLAALDTPIRLYTAQVSGEWAEKDYPLPATIVLRVGAQVMVRKNGADVKPDSLVKFEDSKLVNGTLGVIASIEQDYIVLESGDRVYEQEFQRTGKRYDEDNKTWIKEVLATFIQMPLTPAWAISMHKSQGQSFDAVNIDPSKVFAPGQLYVALSRARTLKGMTLLSPVLESKFTVNRNVANFYQSI